MSPEGRRKDQTLHTGSARQQYYCFSKGELTDGEEATQELGYEGEHGWGEVKRPDWLTDNVPHYGG
ncbi:UNVERIFIED_ORG: hypothetical protein J2Y78_004840 [Buttiauxella agrestis ATCC 33320]